MEAAEEEAREAARPKVELRARAAAARAARARGARGAARAATAAHLAARRLPVAATAAASVQEEAARAR